MWLLLSRRSSPEPPRSIGTASASHLRWRQNRTTNSPIVARPRPLKPVRRIRLWSSLLLLTRASSNLERLGPEAIALAHGKSDHARQPLTRESPPTLGKRDPRHAGF